MISLRVKGRRPFFSVNGKPRRLIEPMSENEYPEQRPGADESQLTSPSVDLYPFSAIGRLALTSARFCALGKKFSDKN